MLACPVCQLAYRQHVIDIYSSMIDLSDFELKPECTIKILPCQVFVEYYLYYSKVQFILFELKKGNDSNRQGTHVVILFSSVKSSEFSLIRTRKRLSR